MRVNFATILDINYYSRLMLLYQSIRQNIPEFHLYIISLDQELQTKLSSTETLENITTISVESIENEFPELKRLKKTRSRTNYIFTLSPYYPLYILNRYQSLSHICTIDVDQYFFADCTPIVNKLSEYDILLTPHRFNSELIKRGHEKSYGKYNVSFQAFKSSAIGLHALSLWKQLCFEWCESIIENNKYADQKYLEYIAENYSSNVYCIEHIGMGLAPWNISEYTISYKDNAVCVNDTVLILFHYQGLRIGENQVIRSGLDYYNIKPTCIISNNIYYPIIDGLLRYENTDNNIARLNSTKTIINARGYYRLRNGKLSELRFKYYLNKVINFLYRSFKGI